MDNEKDMYIKEKLQKDTLISKKAENTISDFFDREEFEMDEKKTKKNIPQKWRKILVTAASLVIVFGVANVYASTKGYGNVFFLIKYLITGENDYANGKDNILSDRDITISYEPIAITENLSIVIKKLQIKNNEAKLIVLVNEKERLDGEDVPLKYKLYNDKQELLCDQESNKEPDSSSYTEELKIKNFNEIDKLLKLEIYKANSELITNININLETQTIEVAGEKEALSKISEIELKEFLNYVSGLSNNIDNISEDEVMIDLAICMLQNKNIVSGKLVSHSNTGADAYLADEVNQMIKSSFYDYNIDNFKNGNYIIKIKDNGKDYYTYSYASDRTFVGECININNISWNNGIYTVTYTFYHRGIEPDDDLVIDNYDIYEQTVFIKINEDNKYSKFRLISMDNAELIQKSSNSNINDNNSTKTNTDIITNTTDNNNSNKNTITTTNTISNSGNNNNTVNNFTNEQNPTNYYENEITNSNNKETISNTSVPNNTNNNNNTKIDNYASSMSWSQYWAPGLRFQYPTEFTLTEEGGYYRGNNQGELTTRITGIAVGKNPDTNERIESKLMIKIYNPAFIDEVEANSKMYTNGYEHASFENNRGIKWYIADGNSTNEPGYSYSESYSNLVRTSDGSYVETRVEFVTDNIENFKVRNIINWVLGSTQLTSW